MMQSKNAKNGMIFHSIRSKITAITILAILTTVLAIFLACYSTVRVENDRRSVEIMNLIARDTGKSLEKYLESIEQSVETEANLADDTLDSVVLIENGAAGDYVKPEDRTDEQNAALDKYLQEYCDRLQVIFGSIASRSYGVITYYYCINPEISSNMHGFFYSKVGKTGFVEQEPLDARTLDPEDIDHTTWYYTPIKRGRPSWIGPYTAHFLDEMWICSYLVPIYKAGMLAGVLGLDIPVDTLVSQLSSIKVYDHGFASLIDSEGRVIYHPEYEIGFKLEDAGLTISDILLGQKDSGNELIRYIARGEEYQMSFTTLTSGMKLVITAPTREINASWHRLRRIILAVTAFILILFAALVFFFMRLVTQPLLDLTAASQRLASDDYDVELNYKGNDEAGVLTRAFIQMRDRMKQYIEDLNRRIYTDALTGLPNMRYFFELAEAEQQRMKKEGRETVMLYFNLIGMKDYNRQYGFEEGDKLICDIGSILAGHYGEKRVCHLADDHFAVVADQENLTDEIEAVFEDCKKANNGNSLPVSVGIYESSIEEVGVSVACDRAKYASDMHKGTYESGYYTFDNNMIRQIENLRYIINHIDQAIEEEWIKVYYQPIVSAESGRVSDQEALSRWIDPSLGFLSPADFIPVLENAHLIYKLDLYVLDQILRKIRAQMDEGIPVVPHSLNLSRADFDSCDIVEEIRKRVDEAGIARDRLTIEVTESMVGSDFDFMKSQVLRFQELGFCVWMDDFGSGYSSLDVLQDIRFDLLKFDMHFIHRFEQNSDKDRESRIILTELVHMANELGVDTICEGVETIEQVEFLKNIGCKKLQGYYFSKPVPFEGVTE